MIASEELTFPRRDPVGPDASSALQPEQVSLLADLLAPSAAHVDAHGVRRETLDVLADNGLLGSPLKPAGRQRELGELMAGCDASTWFCWVQHQAPLRILETSMPGPQTPGLASLREQLLPGLESGSTLAAVAHAHVRRPGPPNPTATRVRAGWQLDGTLDWVTSWDIADVVMVAAQGSGADADSLVCAYLPAGASADTIRGVTVGAPLDLLAMSGTHTRPVSFSAAVVPVERVGAVLNRREWLARDAVTSSDASPAAFGVARAAIAELDGLAEQRSDTSLADLAGALGEECRGIRRRAYTAIDDPGVPIEERLSWRAASLELAVRSATAVVVARAGAAMRKGQPAERRVRESMFLLVQAQTAATRRASLERISRATASP